MALDIEKIAGDLIGTVQSKAADGWSKISSFVVTQSKMLANQAAWITESRIAGALRTDDELFNFFTDQLKDSVETMARAVAVLTVLTIEETWNAVVGVLWGAINGALKGAGLGFLPIPLAPPQV